MLFDCNVNAIQPHVRRTHVVDAGKLEGITDGRQYVACDLEL